MQNSVGFIKTEGDNDTDNSTSTNTSNSTTSNSSTTTIISTISDLTTTTSNPSTTTSTQPPDPNDISGKNNFANNFNQHLIHLFQKDNEFIIIMSIGCVVLGGLNIASFIFCVLQLKKRNALAKNKKDFADPIKMKTKKEYVNDSDDSSIEEQDKERNNRKTSLKARSQMKNEKSKNELQEYEEINYEERYVDSNRSNNIKLKRNIVQRASDSSKSSSTSSSSGSKSSQSYEEDEEGFAEIRL